MHVKWSLFLVQALPAYLVPGNDNSSFPLASLPQVMCASKSGTGRGSSPHGPAAHSGLGKPGIQKPHRQRKEPLRGKARALGCAATAEDVMQLSSLYSCIRYQGHLIPSSSNMIVERTNPLYSIPAQVGSALFHCQIAPGKTSLQKKIIPGF